MFTVDGTACPARRQPESHSGASRLHPSSVCSVGVFPRVTQSLTVYPLHCPCVAIRESDDVLVMMAWSLMSDAEQRAEERQRRRGSVSSKTRGVRVLHACVLRLCGLGCACVRFRLRAAHRPARRPSRQRPVRGGGRLVNGGCCGWMWCRQAPSKQMGGLGLIQTKSLSQDEPGSGPYNMGRTLTGGSFASGSVRRGARSLPFGGVCGC